MVRWRDGEMVRWDWDIGINDILSFLAFTLSTDQEVKDIL